MKFRHAIGGLLAVMLLLGAVGCAPERTTAAGIPTSLWERGVTDPLRPKGLYPGTVPQPVPIVASYDDGLDHIGDWVLLAINADKTKLTIQYSQGGGCSKGLGVIVAQTPTAVALVPVYQNNPGRQACTAQLHTPTGIVALAASLGARKLLHLPGDDTIFPPPTTPSP